jgi:AbrB family looped-hinge helix DNA binding protein
MMQVKARRVGNSIAVTIPKNVAAELGIDENTDMNVLVRGNTVVLEPVLSRWDRLLLDVRRQAQSRGLTERDVTEAIAEIRGQMRQ